MTTEQTHRTARGFINRPGHWTMAVEYPHLCIYCGGDYDAHKSSWPEMLCPVNRTVLIEAAPELLKTLEHLRDYAEQMRAQIQQLLSER